MRNITAATIQESLSQNSDKAYICLLTVTHASWSPTSFEFANNSFAPVISNGITYQPLAFQVTFPSDADDELPQARLILSNVSREIIWAFRGVSGAVDVNLKWVLSSQLNSVDVSMDAELLGIEYDAQTIAGTLSFTPILDRPAIQLYFTPSTTPGVFS